MNHCISSKSTSWDQIPTNIATAVICLTTNQKYNFSKLIFDGMMRHLDAKKKFVMYPRFISVFLDKQLKNVPVPLDHFPINALTRKVFSFMVKKGKNFSGNITPLFESMLVPPTEDEGEASERQSEPQPTPSPPHPSADQHETQPDPSPRPSPTIPILDSIPEGSGGNHGGQSSSDRSLSGNEDGLTLQSTYQEAKEESQTCYHTAQILDAECIHEAKIGRKEIIKDKVDAKGASFDDLDDIVDDAIDYMESEDAQDEGRTSSVVLEEKENTQKGVSTKVEVSTVKSAKGIDKPSKGTDRAKLSTDRPDEGTAEKKEQHLRESASLIAPTVTSTPTPTVFSDDETIAQVLIIMSQNKEKLKEKEKGIDPKAKGKGRIEEEDESDTESKDITETKKKFKQLANDEEVSRKVQEEWEAKEEKKRLTEEEATKAALSNECDFIQARLNADKILAEKLQEEERERERCKKHSDLKTKSFEEIQQGDNEQVADASKKRVKKDDSVKREIKEEEGTRKRMLGTRKKMKSKKRKFTSKDDEELRLCLTIVSDEDKEVDYEILDKKYPIIEWRSEYLTTKPQYDETEEIEDVYLNVVIRSNRQRRYFSTLMAVLSILDRDDICAIYQLVMNRYQDETPEGFDKILWGDLIIMFNQSGNDEFWNAQQNWKIVSWKLHSSSGVHTIMTDEGLVIHMLVENKYPLKKEVLSKLLELKLETEEDSTMALELIRFVKKQIAELEPKDSDGDEEDP
ncbi:hypothetical protein Tco_0015069 [Tanacetum coccineum]